MHEPLTDQRPTGKKLASAGLNPGGKITVNTNTAYAVDILGGL
jgi:hypothetical protein